MTRRLLTIPLLLLPFIACDQDLSAPTGCDVEGACAVEGPDLMVRHLEVDFAASQPVRPEVGMHVVEPGDELRLSVEIFNRGTEPAPSAYLVANDDTADVRALQPGEAATVTFDVTMPDPGYSLYMEHWTQATIRWKTEGFEDASWENNAATTASFHLLVPVLSAEVEMPDTLRALTPYHLTVRVTNESPLIPYHGGLDFGFCFYDDGYSCNDTAGGVFSLPPIMAGEQKTTVARLVVPHVSIDPDWHADDTGVWICIDPPLADFGDFWIACMGGGYPWVRPNIEAACNPRVLALPDSIDTSIRYPDCRHGGDQYWRSIVALDAAIGVGYRFAAEPGSYDALKIVDLDGREYERPGGIFTAPRSDRFYILSRGTGLIHVTVEP